MLKLKTKENIDKVTTVERFGSSQLFKLFYNGHKSVINLSLIQAVANHLTNSFCH